MHEFHVGGEAGCEIDHHRPQNGAFARPDLMNVYENLYWCCRECNQNKGDMWPSPEQYNSGLRFLDPCQPEDDHDRHIQTNTDGTITAKTSPGLYTVEHLMLWREMLVFHRERCYRWQKEQIALTELLATRAINDTERSAIETRLAELTPLIEPPVFNRPRR